MGIEQDYEAWDGGEQFVYGGYIIRPRHDLMGTELTHAWMVVEPDTEDCVFPADVWAPTVEHAKLHIDLYLAAGENGKRFRHLLHAMTRWTYIRDELRGSGPRLP